jgi:DNA-binding transcriptional LysR family regulator
MSLITQPFMENPLIAIAHPDHPLLKNKKNSIKALSKETWWWWQLKSLNVQSRDLRFVRYLPLIVPTWQSPSNKFDRISCQCAWEKLFCL